MTNQSETTNKHYRQIVSKVPTVRFDSTVTRFNRKIPAIVFCWEINERFSHYYSVYPTLAKTPTFNMNTVVSVYLCSPLLSPWYRVVQVLISPPPQ